MATRGLVILLLCVLITLPALASAQTYGDGLGIGGILLPSGSGTLLGKMRLGDALGIEAMIGLSTFSDDGNSSSDFELGIGALLHQNAGSQIQPYFGGRFTIQNTSSDYDVDFEIPTRADTRGDDGDSHTTFGLIGVVGAEYFVTKKVSLEGEIGLGLHFGSFSMSTNTTLGAFLYL